MNDVVVYVDSSALIKLVLDEPESLALATFLESWPVRVSSALARVEVLRIAARVQDPSVEREARRVLNALHLVRMDDGVVASATTIGLARLRSLDAIHLATAQLFGHHLAGMVIYDRRLAAAARDQGIAVWAPA